MDKPALINKIKALDILTNAEKSDLLNLLNNTKKYGLVWEDKPEDVEHELLTMLPVLREVPERRVLAKDLIQISSQTEKSKPGDPTLFSQQGTEIETDAEAIPGDDDIIEASKDVVPNHILIEGDNLHALTALSFTHEGKIDVMYFDPPYNTGNKDFKYNDSFVDKEDTYRHSKWISFMHKRLLITKKLLSEKGVVFISIDDNEQAQLKLLCDEVFGEGNFLADVIWEKADSPRMDAKFFSSRHDHTLVFVKNINSFELGKVRASSELIPEHYSKIDESGRAYYLKPLRAMGKDGKREARPTMYYGITAPDGSIVFPKNPDGSDSRWRWSKEKLEKELIRTKWLKTKKGWALYFLIYADNNETKPPETIWFNKEVGSNRTSKLELTSICPDSSFDTPKPMGLIKRILNITSIGVKHPIILDIFAGSGTTLHATMALNAEDGGHRQCILVTNNENKICEEVTYERNKRVIKGYTNAKGGQVPGLTNNNLRYYKTGFVPSAKTEINRRLLTNTSTELLQIKEDCYNDITTANGLDPKKCCIFTNESGKYLIIVFHSRHQHEVIEQLCEFIQNLSDLSEKVRLYAFSPETETLAEDFYSVADKINAVPLPDAIYNAYRATFKTLKLEKKVFSPTSPETIDEQGAESETSGRHSDLFEQEE